MRLTLADLAVLSQDVFAVLSQDVFTVPVTALPATRSVLTLIGGRVVYDALSPASTRRIQRR